MAVTADVSRGPQFRWTPACGATYMEVTSADKQQVLWAVRVDTGKIAPGVIYGSSPPASELLFGPLPLVAGTAYLARVGIRVQENSFAIFGEGAFVR